MKIRLQEILDNQNITVYSLSKEIGVAQNNLGKLIKGETTSIKYDILEKLCIALKVTPSDIFVINYPYTDSLVHDTSNEGYIEYTKDIENMENHYEEIENERIENEKYYNENKEELDRLFLDYHIRSDSELKLDKLISKFIDILIDGLFLNINFDSSVKETFQKSKGHDYFTTNLKVNKFYTYFYRFLNHYSDNKDFIKTLDNIKHIYNNGGLEKLSDNELNNLKEKVEFLIHEDKQKD